MVVWQLWGKSALDRMSAANEEYVAQGSIDLQMLHHMIDRRTRMETELPEEQREALDAVVNFLWDQVTD